MKLYGGVDLHSNNSWFGIMDKSEKKVLRKKLPNELPKILNVLKPYCKDLVGLAVESTFNWYWLAL